MAKRMAVVGTYMWTKRLAVLLEKHAGVICSPVSEVRLQDVVRLASMYRVNTTIRVGFRPGQLRPRALVLDLACIFYVLIGKKLVFYWTGSDVPRTARLLSGTGFLARLWSVPVARLLLRKSQHCAAAPWLVNELEALGYSAESFPFPTPTERFENLRNEGDGLWPAEFTVLTYVPDHNYHNYCGDEILDLAKRMPHVQFRTMGGEGKWCVNPPDNLVFLGWTDAIKEYQRCVVLLRAVRHDALGGTVREALLCGRYVLYTYPHEFTEFLPHPDERGDFIKATEEVLEGLCNRFLSGQLLANKDGAEWVKRNLSEEVLAQKLAGRWVE